MKRYIYPKLERVMFGVPAAQALKAEVERRRAKRVLFLVSTSLNRKSDIIQNLAGALGGCCAAIHDGIAPHTPRDAVIAATARARTVDADLIVACGGGTVIDAAKLVQFCLKHDVHAAEELDALRHTGAILPSQGQGTHVRQISLPTTLSGAEFSAGGGATDRRTKVKELFWDPLLIPAAVILDPALSLQVPLNLWLSTGIRAIDHAIESLCSADANPFTDGFAEKAIRLLDSGLRKVAAEPNDLAARQDCMIGAWLAMTPVQGGLNLGISHALGHVLGGTMEVPHGYTSCVLMPAALRFNRDYCRPQQEKLSEIFGCASKDVADVVAELISSLGLPQRLSEVGITRKDFPRIMENTMREPWTATNPRPLRIAQDMLPLLEMVV